MPDFYQGSEYWDLSLVDPDNRRPVDFADRERALSTDVADFEELAAHWTDGHVKLALSHRLLRLRHDFAELLRRGSYAPRSVTGPARAHIIAFTRQWKNDELLIAVGRHFAPLTNGGRQWLAGVEAKFESEPDQSYQDLLGTAPQLSVDNLDFSVLMQSIPVAVLLRRRH